MNTRAKSSSIELTNEKLNIQTEKNNKIIVKAIAVRNGELPLNKVL
jgi:hypothetical protein